MQLEMPHVNVLSKIDLLSTYGKLRASLPIFWSASRSTRSMEVSTRALRTWLEMLILQHST